MAKPRSGNGRSKRRSAPQRDREAAGLRVALAMADSDRLVYAKLAEKAEAAGDLTHRSLCWARLWAVESLAQGIRNRLQRRAKDAP